MANLNPVLTAVGERAADVAAHAVAKLAALDVGRPLVAEAWRNRPPHSARLAVASGCVDLGGRNRQPLRARACHVDPVGREMREHLMHGAAGLSRGGAFGRLSLSPGRVDLVPLARAIGEMDL